MLLKPSLREKKRYIVIKLYENQESPQKIMSKLAKIFGILGMSKYGISVVKITNNYIIIRCKHKYVKEVIAGIVLLHGSFVPKILKVTGTLRKARNIIR